MQNVMLAFGSNQTMLYFNLKDAPSFQGSQQYCEHAGFGSAYVVASWWMHLPSRFLVSERVSVEDWRDAISLFSQWKDKV